MNRTQEELERRIFYLSALNDLGKELGPLQELSEICTTALSVTMGALGTMRGLVWLGARDESDLLVNAQRGLGDESLHAASAQHLFSLSGGTVRRAGRVDGALGEALNEAEVEVWIPQSVNERVLGGMGLGKRMSGEPFGAEEMFLLGTIGDTMTMALNNALLYEDLQRANEQLEQENRSLRVQLESDSEVVSRNAQMQSVLQLAWRAAESPSTVLLQGESGTGKEVIARAIHRRSAYSEGLFVPVHCAALPSELLESELFGHEKGAFTGAITQRLGRFEMAQGGTLFLDEVGEIGLDMQVKLLRVLQERAFERVGGTQTVEVDVRVLAATNRDLAEAVREGQFREDLYYRLNVVPIVLPPLRERVEDIASFVDRFLSHYADQMGRSAMRVSAAAMDLLMAYRWPGNVRELQNWVERMVVVADSDEILPRHLPGEVQKNQAVGSGDILPLGEIERQHVEAALAQCKWNQTDAAELLKITRAQLRHRIKQHGIVGGWRVGAPVRKTR